jgi:oligosaccharyltransferase complex subunit epsilon
MGHWAPPARPPRLTARAALLAAPPPLPQFVYAKLVGTFPFNSFLAAFFCCVGAFVLTLSLRMKVAEGGGKGGEAEFGGYALAMCTLFIASWNYIG